jgi:Zn-finger nucleic acid-binding protein
MRSAEQLAAMSCPVCRVPLAMSDRQGIEIDYCPQCRGVWLDRGELDKIIERSAPQPAPAMQQPPAQPPAAAPPPQPVYVQQPWGGQPHYGHKKRKSWLEEIFD